jgi:hypothetical protein
MAVLLNQFKNRKFFSNCCQEEGIFSPQRRGGAKGDVIFTAEAQRRKGSVSLAWRGLFLAAWRLCEGHYCPELL